MIGVRNSTDDRNIPFNESQNKKLESMIDEYDANFLSYIARLYQAINGEKLDFENIKNNIDALAKFNKKQEYNYLNNLLYPERCRGVKIPSPVPVPSCSFQLHNCVTLRTNASGNLGIVFNPFFLCSNVHPGITNYEWNYVGQEEPVSSRFDPEFYSSFFVNNADDLTGYASNVNWNPINIGQQIPPVYNQYRLVSASLVVKYIGRLDIASGVIGGAIVFDESKDIGCYGNEVIINTTGTTRNTYSTAPPNLEKYGNFDLAMDSFYHQENLCIEGMRELYFPIDNSYEEYVKLLSDGLISGNHTEGVNRDIPILSTDESYLKNGFRYMVYVLGAPPSSSCFKVDIYCNFECLPNAEFMNYLPLTLNLDPTTPEEKKETSIIIQQKPIMKVSETEKIVPQKPSIWRRMIDKFKGNLPGIGKLLTAGLVTAVPALKPGLALANTVIDAVAGQQQVPMNIS
jgi:hypothetical protein